LLLLVVLLLLLLLLLLSLLLLLLPPPPPLRANYECTACSVLLPSTVHGTALRTSPCLSQRLNKSAAYLIHTAHYIYPHHGGCTTRLTRAADAAAAACFARATSAL
jgi:hypothetical protein